MDTADRGIMDKQGMSKGMLLGVTLAALGGCATANIRPQDMAKLGAAPTVDDISKIAHGSPAYRLDYLAGGHSFIYETYEESGSSDYYGLLFQDGRFVAAHVMPEGGGERPGVRDCTTFVPELVPDVDACFQDFNRRVIASAIDFKSGVTDHPAGSQYSRQEESDAAEEIFYVAAFGPILIPAAVITLPVLGASALADRSRRDAFKVTLGEPYADVQSRVATYPAEFVSVTNGKGTVLVPGGGLTSDVVAAFGVADGKVIWIDLAPKASCVGGFLASHKQCGMDSAPYRAQ